MEPTTSGSPGAAQHNQSPHQTKKRTNTLFHKPDFFKNPAMLHAQYTDNEHIDQKETSMLPVVRPDQSYERNPLIMHQETQRIPVVTQARQNSLFGLTRGKAFLLLLFLFVVVIQTFNVGPSHFLGSQGWAYVLSDPLDPSLNLNANNQPAKNGTTTQAQMTPEQYVEQTVAKMSLDQKIGQMMMVQFLGPDYSLDLNTMISQYHVGSVLLFAVNDNIVSEQQLITLNKQIQRSSAMHNAGLPMTITTDQEGGAVNRLAPLKGDRLSAATIGATNDPNQAKTAGLQDAKDLSAYGINLNLAPVVDIDLQISSSLHTDGRTFGQTPEVVTQMASAYLKGLQQDKKVVGTLKHFPGLGDTTTDPHFGLPILQHTIEELEKLDWAPYRALIKQGDAHAIMVTHEMVPAIDDTRPASLSPKLIDGILRKDMGFKGVIMTDSLTMAGITHLYTPGEAAAIAVAAGSDIIMGANSPNQVDEMFKGIKQAITNGTITEGHINASVQRILMLKYHMGLLPVTK